MPKNKRDIVKLQDLPMEVRDWLEVQFKKPISNETILAELQKHCKWITKFPLKEIAEYRSTVNPGYEKLLEKESGPLPIEEIEEEVEEQLARAKEDEEPFSRDEKKALNLLRSHRRVLAETWENYKLIKPGDDERAKKDYLMLMENVLGKVEVLTANEESLMSALDTVRQAEVEMSIESHFDSLCGWFLPRMAEKGKDQHEILEYLFKLQLFMNYYSKIVMDSTSISEANKRLLEEIYGDKETHEPK